MTRAELIVNVAEKAKLDRKSDALVEGDKVQVLGFGTFENRTRAARKGRNPRTGEEIEIKSSKLPSFKAGKSLKEAVNY